jgi:L-malate glycosyltransferase
MSGAERCLLSLLDGLPPTASAAAVASPEGPLAEAVRDRRLPFVEIGGTDASLRLHPRHTSRALTDLGRTALHLRKLARSMGVHLVHANSIRAGLIAAFATRAGGPPAVVSFHDRLPAGAVSSLTLRLINSGVSAILACSDYTAQQARASDSSALVRVVYNPVDFERFDPSVVTREEARVRLGLDESAVILAVVAQLTPWKAQDDAIRILAHLRRRQLNARLLLAGSAKFISRATRYDNDAYRAWLGKLALALEVERYVHFLGERDDVADIFAAADVALLPSWEEPFGRSIVEAMAMTRPVVATNVGGPPEILTHGKEGLLLPPRVPELWAHTIEDLIEHPDTRAALGQAGRRRVVAQFSVARHVEAVLDVYSEAVRRRTPLSGGVDTASPTSSVSSVRSAHPAAHRRDRTPSRT